MDSVDTALNLIERYAKLAYLSNGEFLGTDIRDKQVYLSGPITGEKNYKGLFSFARDLVEFGGAAKIYSPAVRIPARFSWEQAMKHCLSEITGYDTVVMLPEWEASDGARLEHDVALACGIHVVDFTNNKIIYGLYYALKETLEKCL
ncbi:hypothetical protein Apar_0563 [Lancefieldella parvula DSM 20469]|uniref:DUF4406 domain-containing protein n=1 Tax=Lancefieldella parvula (strain ATCC 33793 / DSM 20469 / CCUG 32760 / JCM 10300 / KCTC 3663 / VPI 0546 / 1246) TaxID=521095 RepID=C8WA55_LANP1|nr:DUF4406 domain-containing protein [Lancefieldella parvula]ACV50993.1 hypothetical protein Apar_0563 [Lancefieldella parvula DSM 20469]